MGVFIQIIRFVSLFMYDGEDTAHFMFPVQFFENFFGAMFFLTSGGDFFVPTILAMLIWITLRNSGLLNDCLHLFGNRFPILKFLGSGKVAGRIVILNTAKSSVQYFLSDILTNISVPILFYVQITIYLEKFPVLASEYAAKFGVSVNDIQSIWTTFGAILGSRIAASLLTLAILRFKFGLFNKKCIQYNMKTISLPKTIIRHINAHALFFVVLAIQMMNINLENFDNLFASSSATVAAASNSTQGYPLTFELTNLTAALPPYCAATADYLLGIS